MAPRLIDRGCIHCTCPFTGTGRTHHGPQLLPALALAPGGYMSVWTPKTGWTQNTAATTDGTESRAVRSRRPQRRTSIGT